VPDSLNFAQPACARYRLPLWSPALDGQSLTSVQSPLLEYLAITVRLAGLFHDLGKGTVGFSRKLTKAVAGTLAEGEGNDPIRHEVVSALLIDVADPEAWLEQLSCPTGVFEAFEAQRAWLDSEPMRLEIDEHIQVALKMAGASRGSSSVAELNHFAKRLSLNNASRWAKYPLWMSVLWLVFTHHKLPTGGWLKREGSFISVLNHHFGIVTSEESGEFSLANIERLGDFLKLPSADQPWRHGQWRAAVVESVQQLLDLRKKWPGFEHEMFACGGEGANKGFGAATSWMTSLVRVGRLSLVLGDYEASCDAVKEVFTGDPENRLFANTKMTEDSPRLADRLHVHLRKAGDFAEQILRGLFIQQAPGMFNPVKLGLADKPASLRVPESIVESPYAWQGYAQQHMQRYAQSEKGFFCVVAAGTGRGKTRACAAIMTSARLHPRFSVLLSMRSLTFQTSSAYLSETVGFRPDQVAMFVGDDVLKRRFREQKKTVRATSRQRLKDIGTDNRLSEPGAEQYSVVYHGSQRATLQLACLQEDHHLMRMLSAPVSVMTVDHVIRLIDLAKSKDLLQALHLMTTDLILDEVDDYRGDDLICIGRLIEIAGQFGRRVIIASATLPKTVVDGFRDAYFKGYAVYQSLYGTEDADSLIVTHLAPYFSQHETGSFGEFYTQVMDTFSEEERKGAELSPRRIVRNMEPWFAAFDSKRPPERRLDLVAESTYTERTGKERTVPHAQDRYFSSLLYTATEAHKDNRLKDNDTGISYSAGFVRLNTVKSAQKFAQWLIDSDLRKHLDGKGLVVKLVCYHAQNIGLVRVLQERFLESHLNRTRMNDGAGDPLLDNADFKTALAKAKEDGKQHVVMMVVTSSIMETGRDFDFDWCVLEPCSTTSIVQAGGRVRRHRRHTTDKPNVLVMPVSLAGMTDDRSAWRDLKRSYYVPQQSVERNHGQALQYLTIQPQPAPATPLCTRTALSPLLVDNKPLHAGHCLTTPPKYALAPLTAMERVKQLGLFRRAYAQSGTDHFTLEYATRQADALLCSTFYENSVFRGTDQSTKIEYLRGEAGWFTFNSQEQVKSANDCIFPTFHDTTVSPDIYLLSALNILSIDQMLALTDTVAGLLGYRPEDQEDMSLAESALLSMQKSGNFTSLWFDPQLGFYQRV
jgi:CRISPR/Cas system-associated endonuclease/helicase Cas3